MVCGHQINQQSLRLVYVQKSDVLVEDDGASEAADLSADGDEHLSLSLLCWLWWCLSLPKILPKMSLIVGAPNRRDVRDDVTFA